MAVSPKNKTDLADLLALHIRAMRLPTATREYRAIDGRQFRIDIAFVSHKLAVEVDGGENLPNGGGRHNRAAGMASDSEKQNLLLMAGWRCMRFTGQQVKSGQAIATLEQFFREHPQP